jgi:hypothetical protein
MKKAGGRGRIRLKKRKENQVNAVFVITKK